MEKIKTINNSEINSHKWYAVYTKSRAEKKVRDEFGFKNIECYLPIHRQLRQWSDRKKWVEQPLISGYIFVRIPYKNYLNVLKTDGVVAFVRFEGKPATIPDGQIENLKKILRQGEVKLEVSREELTIGEKVRINAGPLLGVVAELVKFKGKKKVAVRLPEVGTSILFEIPLEELEKLTSNEVTND